MPGEGCAAAGQQHKWVALAWDVTCECTDPRWPKQSNGSFCIYWDPTQPCVKYPDCGTAPGDVTCETFDNVWKMPAMLGVSWLSPFGDKSNVSAPLVAATVNKQPVGARSLLLHDIDQGIAYDTGDRVLLPPIAADCGDPYAPNMPYDPPSPQPIEAPSFSGIWWDEAALKRRTQSLEFFGAFKKAGGQLDDLVQDSEESSWGMQVPQPTPDSINNATTQRCMRARWTAIQNDVRFRDVLPALTALGFSANFSAPEWLADELLPFSTSPTLYMDQVGALLRRASVLRCRLSALAHHVMSCRLLDGLGWHCGVCDVAVSVCVSVGVSACLCVSLSFSLLVCLHLSACPSVCLPACLPASAISTYVPLYTLKQAADVLHALCDVGARHAEGAVERSDAHSHVTLLGDGFRCSSQSVLSAAPSLKFWAVWHVSSALRTAGGRRGLSRLPGRLRIDRPKRACPRDLQ